MEGSGGQHLVGGIHVHVILFRVHLEVGDAPRDGVLVVNDVDLVVRDVIGVGHPLATHHPLVIRVVPERVTHATVPAGNAHAASDGVQ